MAGLGERAPPVAGGPALHAWDHHVAGQLEVLLQRGAPGLRARGERLQDGLAVQLGVGELADQVRGTGDGRQEAYELAAQVVARCGVGTALQSVATHARRGVHSGGGGGGREQRHGAPDVQLFFSPGDEGADARRRLLDGPVHVEVGGRQQLVPIRSVVPHLSRDTVQVVMYRLPPRYAVEGAVEVVLQAAGYGPDRVSVQAVFLGDLPAACHPWLRGVGNADVIIALVSAPVDDPWLRFLPRTLYAGWDVRADIRVRTWAAQRDPLVPPPLSPRTGHHPAPCPPRPPSGGGLQAGVRPPSPPLPTQPPVQSSRPQSSQPPLWRPPPPLLSHGLAVAPYLPFAGAPVMDPAGRSPSSMPPPPARDAEPGVGGGEGVGGPEPMAVGVCVPDCPLAEACFAFLEDWVEGMDHEMGLAIVAGVAGEHGSAWAGCAEGRVVPEWCQRAMLMAVRARCPAAVVTRPARIEWEGPPPPLHVVVGRAATPASVGGPAREGPLEPPDVGGGSSAPRAAAAGACAVGVARGPRVSRDPRLAGSRLATLASPGRAPHQARGQPMSYRSQGASPPRVAVVGRRP